MLRNKRAEMGSQIMVLATLFLMVIIAVGIAAGVSLYFGSGVDARQADADILKYKIENCFNEKSISDIGKNIFDSCGLNKDSFNGNSLVFKICENSNLNDCTTSSASFLSSGSNFQSCLFTGKESSNTFLKCSYAQISRDGRNFVLITGSSQQIRRINA